MMNSSSSAVPRNKPREWFRVLRPLAWWALLVLALFAHRTHQRLMEETRLRFEVRAVGRWSADEAQATLDGIPVSNGQQVSLGRHRLEAKHPKAQSFSTNLFIWYRGLNLGVIQLERGRGNLKLAVQPAAKEIVVAGPDARFVLTDSQGMTSSVPTDTYSIDVNWSHYQQSERVQVFETSGGFLRIAPTLGAIRLTSSHPATTFLLLNATGQSVAGGNLPDTIYEVPSGVYQFQAERRGQKSTGPVEVNAGGTNEFMVKFKYGAVTLETDPPGASVVSGEGENLGRTPITLSEVPLGIWKGDLRREGYLTVPVSVSVSESQTNLFRTNLVNLNYAQAMVAARNYRDAGDLERAMQAVDEALKVEPDDSSATALRRELTIAKLVGQAKASASREDYRSAQQAVKAALQLVPENPEVIALANEISAGEQTKKKRDEAQVEQRRQECSAAAKKAFDSALADLSYSDEGGLFEKHELQISGTLSQVESRILKAFDTLSPSFHLTKRPEPCPDAFVVTGRQELAEGGRRSCVVSGTQLDEQRVRFVFEVMEYKTKHDVSLAGGLSFNTSYVPLHRSRTGELTEKMKAQIAEGQRLVTENLTGGSR